MNKTILITGAAKRIGKEIALTYSDLGWNIIIHFNSSKDDAEKLANQINSKNPNTAKIIQANLDVDSEVTRLVDEAKGLFETIDILVNNASTFYPTPIEDISLEHWTNLVGSNLKGPLFLINGLRDKLKESNGSIINITDTNLSKGVANFSIYSAAIKDLENTINIRVYYPSLKYCGDNAAMIAFVGSLRSSDKINIKGSSVRARWPLSELTK